ncbi:MAG: DUF2807 domain-containing protein [Bacteroidales bacterium]|nr:DUF2807 domain-containing protein [Bacteroidales bacterium]
MKTKLTPNVFLMLVITGLISFTFSSCDPDDFNCIRGKGTVFTETRNTPDFISVDLRVPATVTITQADNISVEVKTFDNLLPEILTYVNGSTLIIENDHCLNVRNDDIEVFISAPDFSKLKVSGSGEIISTNMLDVADIDLNLSGSGSIDVGLITAMANSRVSGSGSIWIEGEAYEHNIEISGSGNIYSFPFYTERTNITVSGSGNCEVRVSDRLDVNISGSGVVKYKDYPDISSVITGSGKIINAN